MMEMDSSTITLPVCASRYTAKERDSEQEKDIVRRCLRLALCSGMTMPAIQRSPAFAGLLVLQYGKIRRLLLRRVR